MSEAKELKSVEPVAIVKEVPRLAVHPQSFKQMQYVRSSWVVSPPDGTSFERIQEPDYWAHVAFQIRPNDIIEVHPEDGSYFAELYVRASSRNAVKTFVLRHVDLADQDAAAAVASNITVKYRGPNARYCLMSGKNVVATGFQTEEEAMKAVGDYAKEFAA